MPVNVAIDGPAGAGKSTVAKGAAKALNYIYVDTGALYRTVGLYFLRKSGTTKNKEEIIKNINNVKVDLKFIDGEQRVFLGDDDVSQDIRTPEASMGASDVSAIPQVRAFLLDVQREIAKKNNCIMDGRDIGTVVLPDAKVKIFLTAAPELRAKRRYDELIAKGMTVEYEDVLKDQKQRDYQDMNRAIAPLKQAEDAVLVDSTAYSVQENIDIVVDIIKQKTA